MFLVRPDLYGAGADVGRLDTVYEDCFALSADGGMGVGCVNRFRTQKEIPIN
jgi:hypothetical protein